MDVYFLLKCIYVLKTHLSRVFFVAINKVIILCIVYTIAVRRGQTIHPLLQ